MLPAVTRFAGAALRALYPSLGQASLRTLAPWKAGAGEIAMDVLPNLAFAIPAGLMLPGKDEQLGFEGASALERIGAGLVDFGLSYPTGALGRLSGLGVARGLGGMRGRQFGPGTESMIQNLAGIGAETGLWTSGLLRNPVSESVVSRYSEAAQAAQEQFTAQEKRAYRDQIIAEEQKRRELEQQALLAGGPSALLAPYGFGGFG